LLIEPYFAQEIAEQRILMKPAVVSLFLNRRLRMVTTQCCIDEMNDIAEVKTKCRMGATLLSSLEVLPCRHSSRAKTDAKRTSLKCVTSILDSKRAIMAKKLSAKSAKEMVDLEGDESDSKSRIPGSLAVCAEQKALRSMARKTPGTPLVWLWNSTLVLDDFSDASKKWLAQRTLRITDIEADVSQLQSEIAAITRTSSKSTSSKKSTSSTSPDSSSPSSGDSASATAEIVKMSDDSLTEQSERTERKAKEDSADEATLSRKRKLEEMKSECDELTSAMYELDSSKRTRTGAFTLKASSSKRAEPIAGVVGAESAEGGAEGGMKKKRKRRKSTSGLRETTGDANSDMQKWFGGET
jgi:rRNA-processing protein FCF1